MFSPKIVLFLFWVIGSSSCQKLWHSNFMGVSDKPRNEFTLKNISVDQKFSLNTTVDYWRSLNSRYSSFAAGVSNGTILILKVTKTEDPRNFNITWKSKEVNENFEDAVLVNVPYQNKKGGEVFLVCISPDKKLYWINVENLELVWSWKLGYNADRIKFGFNNVLNRNQLFLTSKNNMNVYNFDVEKRQLWLAETLECPDSIGLFDMISFRNRFYLLVPQKQLQQLRIYRYIHHFEIFKVLPAEGIDQVVAFQINYKSFFAVDGLESGIYQFDKRNRIRLENITNSHLEGIKYWLPIKVNNLRKNFILFAQREVHHGTLKSLLPETFIYNGEHFEEHEDIPCHIFGEEFNSLNCLTSAQDSIGIHGAAAISVGNNLGLLLAKKSPHNLFKVNFDVRDVESPIREKMKEVKQIREHLQKLLDERLKNQTSNPVVSKAPLTEPVQGEPLETSASYASEKPLFVENQSKAPIVGAKNSAVLLEKIDMLIERLSQLKEKMDKVKEMEEAGNFKKLIISGKAKIENVTVDKVNSQYVNEEPVNDIFEDAVRKNSNETVKGTKTFTDLNVEHLFFGSINGIQSKDIMFHDSDTVMINGNVIFEKPIAIMKDIKAETINGMPSSSIPNMGEHIDGTLSFENLKVYNMEAEIVGQFPDISDPTDANLVTIGGSVIDIPNNVTVKRINGEDFEGLMKQLCLVNIPNHIEGTVKIQGNVTFEEPSFVDHLNEISFPEDYVLTSDEKALFITGKKIFRNTLIANILNSNENYINEFKSVDFFTLSTTQHVMGDATFPNLEITKKFLHEGKTIGKQLKNLLPNPTLADTFNITASVNFESLEVTGSVIVENMDSLNYGRILEDIIYKDEQNQTINSIKEFSEGLTIKDNLEITTKSINRIPLDQIVTKDTQQILNLPQLNGNVSIENVNTERMINGVNITKLDQESVKTFGEQFISSFLIFDEDLVAENLEVKETLNEIPVENFYVTTGDRIISQKPKFDQVEIENLSVSKNVEGAFTQMNLENFTKSRLTYSTPQNLTQNINLVDSRTDKIRCLSDTALCKTIPNEKTIEESMIAKISSGKILVKELLVKDDLEVEQMNGIPLSQAEDLNRNSTVVDGNVYFTNLKVSKLSGVPIREVLEDCIYKNDTDLEIKGLKVFQKGFVVEKLIETERLNDVPIDNLMTKQGEQIIEAPIEIFGNVTFNNDVDIMQTINDVPVQEIQDYFEYKDDIYFIKADVLFNRLTYIRDLDVFGNINNKRSEDVLANIVYLNKNYQFLDEIEFTENVVVDGNLYIKNNLNGISLSDSNDNIVYLNKIKENTIESPVTFTDENVFAHNLLIETDLITKWMRGLNLTTFRENAIFLNRGFLKGTYHFQNITLNENLLTGFINRVDMSKTIPLGSDQDIDGLNIDSAAFLNNVTVESSVNGFDLREEYAKSVLSNQEQTILSEIYFKNNTLIRHNLEVGGLLNGYRNDRIVTTDTNQTLRATYNFTSKTLIESNMYVTGLVNSIQMSDWEDGALKASSKEPQAVLAPWHFGGNLTFEESLESVNGIYDFDVEEEMQLMKEEKDYKLKMDSQYEKDYNSICLDIRTLNRESKKQTYKFQNLEEMQQFQYLRSIAKAHFFNFDKPSMILNGPGVCSVDIFHLEDESFTKISSILMGEIDQIITVRDEGSLFFVVKTKPNPKCDMNGTLVWQYKNDNLLKVQNIENQQLLQESLIPLTFYGMDKNGVTEFRIDMSKAISVGAYRKWKIREENAAFMPRGLGTGLAVRTGKKIIKLLREEPLMDNDIGFESSTIRGEMKVFDSNVIPGRNNNKIAVVHVGPKNLRRTFLAIVFHEDTVVGRNFDVMKVYEDYSENRIFQEISTYNPTSIASLELENGETFLLILENEERLQIYRYRGVEGFRKHLSAELPGSHMFKMPLPVGPSGRLVETVAVVDKDKITILKPVMIGNPAKEDIECS
ncbi:uncharacterized protein LOC123309290 [Coccinella septempunctata]|uniref:uncharacterized protein LOC123309290 n=1 Tax=Coccinella septempunctata TaxID=41139 RepID=UPI001D08D86B|nr:uncharacterized protein LOC123309290 [Coccinella septempunctata]